MLTTILGFYLATHLMTAQGIKDHLQQTLVVNEVTCEVRPAIVQWAYVT